MCSSDLLDLPKDKYSVHATFNIGDLSPFHGYPSDDEEANESWTTLSQGGGDDAGQLIPPTTSTLPIGPMTRSRAQAIQDKVNSFLTLHTFDVSVNGILPHGTTFCVLRYEPPKERQDDARSDQEKVHDAAKKGREDGQEDASKKAKKEAKEDCQEGQPSPGLAPA